MSVTPLHGITPELPPEGGGVADYAARLAAHWPGGGLTSWYVANRAEAAGALRRDWSVQAVPSAATGSGWPDTGTLIVHYTQYGYAGNGIPWRLVLGLGRWRADARGRVSSDEGRETGRERRLVVFFHETWQEGPFWRRRGLIAPLARWCARSLAMSADVLVTNCERHAAQLSGTGDITVLPVPANVERVKGDEGRGTRDEGRAASCELGADGSELSANSSQLIARSTLRVVVFGLPETRLRALRAHRAFLTWLHARGGLVDLVLLGGGDEAHRFAVEGALLAREIAGVAVRRTGLLAEADVSAELSRADLGLSAYAADEVGKSGTLAAFFTHGCPVACAGHDAGGLALDMSMTGEGPRDWGRFQDAGARAAREARVAIYTEKYLGWVAHAARLAELCLSAKNVKGLGSSLVKSN